MEGPRHDVVVTGSYNNSGDRKCYQYTDNGVCRLYWQAANAKDNTAEKDARPCHVLSNSRSDESRWEGFRGLQP